MRIEGRWLLCTDGIERPVIDIHLLLADGHLAALPILIDTGADSTVLSYTVVQSLAGYVQPTTPHITAQSVTGSIETSLLNVDIIFTATCGQQVKLKGPVPSFATPASVDLSVLGRDALDHFDLVYSRSQKLIVLLTHPDTFTLSS